MAGFTPVSTQVFSAFAVVQSMAAGCVSATPATEITLTPSSRPQPFSFAAIGGMVLPTIAGSPQIAPFLPIVASGTGWVR